MTTTLTKSQSRSRSANSAKIRDPMPTARREKIYQIIRVYHDGREEVAWWAMRETETKAILRMHRKLRRPTDPTLDAREITKLLPNMARG